MTFKTIFSGRLEFGSARSFNQVQQFFEQRSENFFRSDVLIKAEDIFLEEHAALDIPRLIIKEASGKSWRNTIQLLEYVAQFAVAGEMSAWKIDGGEVVEHKVIEPKGDKVAVQAFLRGRELLREYGREAEAHTALSQAIEKYERHAKAYERRGFVNYQLKNYDDALYDYNKSIHINPAAAEPYLGRAFVKLIGDDRAGAVEDLDMAIKNSIPLQPIYWQSRRMKADCHLKEDQLDQAITELKFFTQRQFAPQDPNYKWRRRALYHYGKALVGKASYRDALMAFNEALTIEPGEKDPSQAELLTCRGEALQLVGEKGYLQDWRQAAEQGSRRAAELLETAV